MPKRYTRSVGFVNVISVNTTMRGDAMFCSHCGAVVENDAAFCAQCGARVEGEGTPNQSFAQTATQAPSIGQIPPTAYSAPAPTPGFQNAGSAQTRRNQSSRAIIIAAVVGVVAILAVVLVVFLMNGSQNVSGGASGSSSASAAVQSKPAASTSASASSAAQTTTIVDTSRDGWYSTTLDLDARGGKRTNASRAELFSVVSFNGNAVTFEGPMYRAADEATLQSRSKATKLSAKTNTFTVSDSCKFTILPPIEESSSTPRATDYQGFQKGIYNRANDLYDSVITFHVLNGEIVEMSQTTHGNG